MALLVAHYENLSEKYGYEISPPRRLVNQVGYELLEVGDTNEAISVFEANVNWYRSSPNVHNSFGDALLRAGRKEDALASYRRAVDIATEGNDSNLEVFRKNLERASGGRSPAR